MTILFRRIKPFKFRITFDLIAKFLGIPQSQIVRAECWRYILFVHRRDRGGQFISYRKLVLWIQAIASLIQTCTTLEDLWQMGLWVRQECQKFDYDQRIIDYLRRIWIKRRDALRSPQLKP